MGDDDHPPIDKRMQSTGRRVNAAKPLDAAPDNAGAERYPPVSKDDSIERTGRTEQVAGESRGFDRQGANPEPREGARDGGPAPSTNEGRMGP